MPLICIVIPVMDLEPLHDGLHERIHAVLPDALVLYSLNGPDAVSLASTPAADGVVLVPARQGFNYGIVDGCRAALSYGATTVVRMDTHEHPPEILPHILSLTDTHPCIVIDLEFHYGETLRKGSADSYHNLYVIPEIISTHAREPFRLTGAHGFMVFDASVLAHVLPFVEASLAIVAESQPGKVMWAADTLLPICASKLGYPIMVEHVEAEEMRDRDEDKCLAQMHDTLVLAEALSSLHLEGVSVSRSTAVKEKNDE